ncbi:hypothetical protein LO762_30060 [Actinocorallia sp. API 0066]|uniref:hypothetical protein n=1 Tax=Actinocorallia sp. API 0066 TaxID=2896846 RepID=UPI001E4A54CD|nr:hypothetical protein [Actinocorallia sp. API 0066]MCD0453394.1 hypothetical protein [Actinocorallia sp. API 0066]
MPTSQHEALHRIFQEDTGLACRVLTEVLRLPIPPPEKVEIINVDLTDLKPVSRWPDTLLRVESAAGPLIMVIEAQTEPSDTKRRRWARYIAHLQDVHDCDVSLIVTCQKKATARWAAVPFHIGPAAWPSMVIHPLVLGPDTMPVITTVKEAARDVPLAILSALMHSKSPHTDAILESLVDALATIDVGKATHLAEFTESGLGEGPARQKWRTLMATQPHTYISELRAEGRQEGREEGREEGRQEAAAGILLMLLGDRGISVSDTQRELIEGCEDAEKLQTWIRRVATATTADEVLS